MCKAIIEDSDTGERLCPSLTAFIIITPEENSLQVQPVRSTQTDYKLEELVVNLRCISRPGGAEIQIAQAQRRTSVRNSNSHSEHFVFHPRVHSFER